MRIFKTRDFNEWAEDEGLTDAMLRAAIEEMEQGLVEANLGGNVYKKRIAIRGRGKRSSLRTLIAYKQGDLAFFVYGFAKNARANINARELKALKVLAKEMLGYTARGLESAINENELIEVTEE